MSGCRGTVSRENIGFSQTARKANVMSENGKSADDSKSSIAYELLRQRILDGTYGPGYRLVVNTLGPELGMSPIPLREAIRLLQAEGWVIVRRYVGAEVAPADVGHWIENMEALALLEGAAMRLLAGRVTAADIAPAAQLNQQMRAATTRSSVIDAHRFNREFHESLYQLVPNKPLVGFLQQTWDSLTRMRRTLAFYGARAADSVVEHEQLLRMLVDGSDADHLEAFSRGHKERTLEVFFRETPEAMAAAGRTG